MGRSDEASNPEGSEDLQSTPILLWREMIWLTFVAVGTSVPELTTTIAPIKSIPAEVMSRDWPLMLVLTLILLVMVYRFGKGSRVFRREGIFLLAI
jgi:Ca2+/Na+ antiporter